MAKSEQSQMQDEQLLAEYDRASQVCEKLKAESVDVIEYLQEQKTAEKCLDEIKVRIKDGTEFDTDEYDFMFSVSIGKQYDTEKLKEILGDRASIYIKESTQKKKIDDDVAMGILEDVVRSALIDGTITIKPVKKKSKTFTV